MQAPGLDPVTDDYRRRVRPATRARAPLLADGDRVLQRWNSSYRHSLTSTLSGALAVGLIYVSVPDARPE